MIAKDDLGDLLTLLGFSKAGQKYSKTIGDATLAVDWKKGEISYPEAQGLVINERQFLCLYTSDLDNGALTYTTHIIAHRDNAKYLEDTSKVLPLFLTLMMNSPAFQQEAKGKASKSINQANSNATIMRNIKVPVPPLAEQQRIVAEFEAEQRAIAAAEAVIAAAPAKKQANLERHL